MNLAKNLKFLYLIPLILGCNSTANTQNSQKMFSKLSEIVPNVSYTLEFDHFLIEKEYRETIIKWEFTLDRIIFHETYSLDEYQEIATLSYFDYENESHYFTNVFLNYGKNGVILQRKH